MGTDKNIKLHIVTDIKNIYRMSLGSLARYDDAEDEIRDEDHNLVIVPPQPLSKKPSGQAPEPDTESLVEAKPTPPTVENSAKPRMLVHSYDMSDDDMSESDIEEEVEQNKPVIKVSSKEKGKESVINLGLFDGTVLHSTETSSRSNDSFEKSPRPESVSLPPEPEGRCSKSLQEKIAKMIEKKNNGDMNVNEYVQKKKEFRNPSIYEKLITFIGIDEHGTNFPKKLYDPSVWGPESYYDELAKKQKEYHKEKEKEKLKKTHVEFISATKKPATSQAPASLSVSEKKSKWDQKVPPPPKVTTGPPKINPTLNATSKSSSK